MIKISIPQYIKMSCLINTPGTAYSTGNTPYLNPSYLSFNHQGTCLAVNNDGIQFTETPDPNLAGTNSDVAMFSVNGSTLTKVQGPNQNGNFPTNSKYGIELSFSPDDSCLAVINEGGITLPPPPSGENNGQVTMYCASGCSLNQSKCSLSNIANYPTLGDDPETITFSPDGRFVVTANTNELNSASNSNLVVYKVNCDCSLTYLYTMSNGFSDIETVRFTPDQKYLLISVSNSAGTAKILGTLAIFSFNSNTGQLTLLRGPSTDGSYPTPSYTNEKLVINSRGTALAVVGYQNNFNALDPRAELGRVSTFAINPNGTLTFIAYYDVNLNNPYYPQFSPDDLCLIVSFLGSNDPLFPPVSGGLALFSVNSDYTLNFLTIMYLPGNPAGIAYSPNSSLFAVTQATLNQITVFTTNKFTAPYLITSPQTKENVSSNVEIKGIAPISSNSSDKLALITYDRNGGVIILAKLCPKLKNKNGLNYLKWKVELKLPPGPIPIFLVTYNNSIIYRAKVLLFVTKACFPICDLSTIYAADAKFPLALSLVNNEVIKVCDEKTVPVIITNLYFNCSINVNLVFNACTDCVCVKV